MRAAISAARNSSPLTWKMALDATTSVRSKKQSIYLVVYAVMVCFAVSSVHLGKLCGWRVGHSL